MWARRSRCSSRNKEPNDEFRWPPSRRRVWRFTGNNGVKGVGWSVHQRFSPPFATFGRAAVQAAKQRIIQRVREGERTRIRDEFATRVGELLSGEVQQIERGKLVVMLNKFREAEAILPYREQNHREHFHQGEPIRAALKRVEETPK